MDIPPPGTIFLFRGARQGWFRRDLVAGQVLTLEPGDQIVHVSILWDPPGKDVLEVEIGFIPILGSMLQKSIVEVASFQQSTGTDWWPIQQEWRSKRDQGLVGAFSTSLHEAYSMAWITLRESQPQATRETWLLEYAFPMADEAGQSIKSVAVSAVPKRI